MTLTEDQTERPLISHCDSAVITIQEIHYTSSLLILPSGKIIAWPVQCLEDMTTEQCQAIVQYHPEIVIIGTGALHQLPHLAIIHHFANHKIGVEIMSNSAACRTYNVLALEGRMVVAGLML